jgi:4'-phosphopantetheinyl transferase
LIYYTFLPSKSDFTPDKYKKIQHEKALALLKYAVKKEYNYDINDMEILTSEHGKPYFKNYPQIHFSISHCNGLVVCMVSPYICGIDAEIIRNFKINTAKRVFSDVELEQLESSADKNKTFFRLWTLKECFGKAYGFGLTYKLKETIFLLKENGSIICSNSECKFSQFFIGNHIISYCIANYNCTENYNTDIFEFF